MTKDEVIETRIRLRSQIESIETMRTNFDKLCDEQVGELENKLEQLEKDCPHGEMDYHPEPECLWCWRTWL